MNPAVLTFLRHGTVDGPSNVFRGALDDPLDDAGWLQMEQALAEVPGVFARVVSSPLARCSAFAAAYAGRVGVPFDVDPDLAEMRFGDWEGLTHEAVRARHGDAVDRFRDDPRAVVPPGGESFDAFTARVARAVARAAATPGATLVVTHAGVVRAAIVDCLGLDASALSAIAVGHAATARVSYLAGARPILLDLRSRTL